MIKGEIGNLCTLKFVSNPLIPDDIVMVSPKVYESISRANLGSAEPAVKAAPNNALNTEQLLCNYDKCVANKERCHECVRNSNYIDRYNTGIMCEDKKCCSCGKTGDDVTFAPDPYRSDVNNDNTPVWECANCRYESNMEI